MKRMGIGCAAAVWLCLVFTGSALGQHGNPPPAPVSHSPMPYLPTSHPAGQGNSGSPLPPTTVVLLALGVGSAFVVLMVLIRLKAAQAPERRIRIVAPPPGEAPDDVRQAWVGLELPLVRGETGPRTMRPVGVVSTENKGPMRAYAVDGPQAVKLLADQSASAAEWWRSNAPHVLAPGYELIFDAEVCEEVAANPPARDPA